MGIKTIMMTHTEWSGKNDKKILLDAALFAPYFSPHISFSTPGNIVEVKPAFNFPLMLTEDDVSFDILPCGQSNSLMRGNAL